MPQEPMHAPGPEPAGTTSPHGSPGSRLILILSPERSGSTLLSMMLGGHRSIISPPEMHMLAYETFDQWLADYPSALRSLAHALESLRLPHGEGDIRRECAGLASVEVYRRLVRHSARAGVFLIDKTPRYARETATLQRAEQLEPFYIWLIRHPLGMTASRISYRHVERRRLSSRHWLYRLKFPLFMLRERVTRRRHVAWCLDYWRDLNRRVESFLATIPPSRQIVVHYEHLVRHPRAVMEQAAAALGLSFEPAMLNPRDNLPPSLEASLGDWKIKERTGIDPGAADTWRRDYDESLLDRATIELMERYGVPQGQA